jgi:hypothetical protein
MVRQERIRRRVDGDPERSDTEARADQLPRRPVADTGPAAHLLERIRQLLLESRHAG